MSGEMTPQERAGVDRFLGWRTRPKERRQDHGEASPQQVYAEWMKSTVGPALRAQGLRGSAGRFEFPSNDVWARLGFQKSAYSDGQEVRFTVNLLAIPRQTWDEQAGTTPHLREQPSPSILYGAWADQTRLGLLTPHGEDKWWRIIRGVDPAGALDNALSDVVTYAVPWLRLRLQ